MKGIAKSPKEIRNHALTFLYGGPRWIFQSSTPMKNN
jgi:hypothetical protein